MKEKKKNVVARLKMNNTERKHSEGITLIALIITIIILLILAVVSVQIILNGGIIEHAKNATNDYAVAQEDEENKLLEAEYQMAKYSKGYTGTYTEYVLEKIYGVKIGDVVNYNEAGFGEYITDTTKGVGGSVGSKDATTGKYPLNSKTYTTEDLGWRVLGVNDNGELELISDNPMSDENKLYLANEEGYLYGTDELNRMCNQLYGNGTNSTGKVVATSARSLNVEDINKLAGITTEEQKKSLYSDYGDIWKYRFPTTGDYMLYKTTKADGTIVIDWTEITDSSYQTFRMPGSNDTISSSNRKEGPEITDSYYYYKIADNVKQTTSDGKNMSDIITKGTGTGNVNQFLASSFIASNSHYVNFGVRILYVGNVGGRYIFYSYGRSYGRCISSSSCSYTII